MTEVAAEEASLSALIMDTKGVTDKALLELIVCISFNSTDEVDVIDVADVSSTCTWLSLLTEDMTLSGDEEVPGSDSNGLPSVVAPPVAGATTVIVIGSLIGDVEEETEEIEEMIVVVVASVVLVVIEEDESVVSLRGEC